MSRWDAARAASKRSKRWDGKLSTRVVGQPVSEHISALQDRDPKSLTAVEWNTARLDLVHDGANSWIDVGCDGCGFHVCSCEPEAEALDGYCTWEWAKGRMICGCIVKRPSWKCTFIRMLPGGCIESLTDRQSSSRPEFAGLWKPSSIDEAKMAKANDWIVVSSSDPKLLACIAEGEQRRRDDAHSKRLAASTYPVLPQIENGQTASNTALAEMHRRFAEQEAALIRGRLAEERRLFEAAEAERLCAEARAGREVFINGPFIPFIPKDDI